MAPYNLSDLAVKEIKLPKSLLGPQGEKNYNGRFLLGIFFDFWNIVFINLMISSLFKSNVKSHLTTSSLQTIWSLTDLGFFNTITWCAVPTLYFFVGFYLNRGQSPGLSFTKCRISMKEHDARASLRWASMSLSLYFTLGLSFFMVKKMSERISAHDYLWLDLVAQKEASAPDVMTLLKDDITEEFAEAA